MANERRGYIPIELDKPRTLYFDLNAICLLEDALKSKVTKIAEELFEGEVGANEIRAFLWAGLQHEDEKLTIKQAGSLVTPGNFQEVIKAITKAFIAAMPQGEAKEGNSHVPPEQTEAETQTASIGGTSSE